MAVRPRFTVCCFALAALAGALPAAAAGYTFHRVVIWGEPGELPPRFQQDPASGAFSLLFPGPAPETGWDPVPARRLTVKGSAFVAADPVSILRPRDPDPDWLSASLEGSLDLNQDGRAEVLRARTVMVPDSRDPAAGDQRVIVELLEDGRILFADLLGGISGAGVRAHSVVATDFTGEGYPDLMIRLEAADRTGAAFYSQRALRYAGSATRRIAGSSPEFRCSGYGIFDLTRHPKDFFARLPAAARPDRPGCPATQGVEGDKLAHCGYSFASPYLGWISVFQVDYVPARSLRRFRLYFPADASPITPEQALDFLVPVFGGDYRESSPGRAGGAKKELSWSWRAKGSAATLEAVEEAGKRRCVTLTLERL